MTFWKWAGKGQKLPWGFHRGQHLCRAPSAVSSLLLSTTGGFQECQVIWPVMNRGFSLPCVEGVPPFIGGSLTPSGICSVPWFVIWYPKSRFSKHVIAPVPRELCVQSHSLGQPLSDCAFLSLCRAYPSSSLSSGTWFFFFFFFTYFKITILQKDKKIWPVR